MAINDGTEMKFAIQADFFISGWDYTGSDGEGQRLLFDTFAEAKADMDDMVKEMGYDPMEWRVVVYDESEDTKEDL